MEQIPAVSALLPALRYVPQDRVERLGCAINTILRRPGGRPVPSLIYDPPRFQGKMVLTDGTLVMDRRAADNKYLHRDFHLYMNMGVDYLGRKFGGAVVDALSCALCQGVSPPLAEKIRAEGLPALQENIAATYAAEEAPEAVHLERRGKPGRPGGMVPGGRHIRNRSEPVSPWYSRRPRPSWGRWPGKRACSFPWTPITNRPERPHTILSLPEWKQPHRPELPPGRAHAAREPACFRLSDSAVNHARDQRRQRKAAEDVFGHGIKQRPGGYGTGPL